MGGKISRGRGMGVMYFGWTWYVQIMLISLLPVSMTEIKLSLFIDKVQSLKNIRSYYYTKKRKKKNGYFFLVPNRFIIIKLSLRIWSSLICAFFRTYITIKHIICIGRGQSDTKEGFLHSSNHQNFITV